jgi:uncharacterized delta-60 repeat protein
MRHSFKSRAARLNRRLAFERLEDRATPALMLDIGFDGDGKLTTDFGFGNDSAQAVALQSGNRIITGGIVWNGTSEDFGLARYLADGTLDRSFGINGGVRTEIFGDHDRILGLAVQPDDKIVAVGSGYFVNNSGRRQSDFLVARYLPNGALDPTFGNNAPGISTVDFFGDTDDFARSVTILNNGQILVGGDSFNPFNNTSDFAIARLHSNGSLDTSFGVQGRYAVDGFGGFDESYAMVVQPDGRIILGGVGQNGVNGQDMLLMRFLMSGFLDTSFFGTGKTAIHFGSGADLIYDIDLQPDGKIVTAGSVFVGGANGFDFALLRLHANGVLDTTFGVGGGVLTDFDGGNDAAFSVDVLTGGRILATGEAFIIADLDVALAAYNPNGSPDTQLLTGDELSPPGTITTDFALGDDSGVGTFAKSDGSILVVGRAFIGNDTDFAVARYSQPRTGQRGNIDSDGDSLLDLWETVGVDANGDGTIDLDLPALGANPMRRDLFVEVDALAGRGPLAGVIDAVIQAFANAPVTNADGSSGIRLHIQMDELNLPAADWLQYDSIENFPVGALQLRRTNFGTAAERANGNSANILAAKEGVFRYGIFGHVYRNGAGQVGSSGIAHGIPGDTFVVTLGTFGSAVFENEAGTFMHEFGHTLGLKHGGGDHQNNKPLYRSVMNYLHQMPRWDVSTPWRLDYDRERAVHDDWGKITYNFRQTDSLLASFANGTVSFKEFDEPPVPNVIDTIPGDYNRDGTVNNLDYSTWRAIFGQSGTGLAADGNGNGIVDTADYVVWRNNRGNTGPPEIAGDSSGPTSGISDGVADPIDYDYWRANFGKTTAVASSGSVLSANMRGHTADRVDHTLQISATRYFFVLRDLAFESLPGSLAETTRYCPSPRPRIAALADFNDFDSDLLRLVSSCLQVQLAGDALEHRLDGRVDGRLDERVFVDRAQEWSLGQHFVDVAHFRGGLR